MMSEAKLAKYILFGTPAAKNRSADSLGRHSAPVHRLKSTRPPMMSNGYLSAGKHMAPEDESILILGGTSASLRSRRRIGAMAPIVNAERPVNAEIPAKLAAFAAALTMNGMLAAGMAYLFNAPLEQHTAPVEQHGAGYADSWADKPQRFYPRGRA
jgi:hypothetical protein